MELLGQKLVTLAISGPRWPRVTSSDLMQPQATSSDLKRPQVASKKCSNGLTMPLNENCLLKLVAL